MTTYRDDDDDDDRDWSPLDPDWNPDEFERGSNDRDDDNPDWKPAARRGQLTLIVMTRARAAFLGISPRAGVVLVGELRPDADWPFLVNFASVDAIRSFIRELAPRTVLVECAAGESLPELQDAPLPLSTLLGRVAGRYAQ